MMTNQFLYQSYQSGDPARLGAQVINGIGLLGAGTIIVTKRNQIKGLTTAPVSGPAPARDLPSASVSMLISADSKKFTGNEVTPKS